MRPLMPRSSALQRLALAAALTLLLAGEGHSEPLSLAGAVEQARSHSPLAQASQLKAKQVQEALHQAQRALGPSLSAVGNYSNSDDPASQVRDANQAGLHLGYDGLPWGPTWSSADLAGRQWDEASLQRDLELQDLDHQVRLAFFAVLEARSNKDAIEKIRNKIEDEVELYLPGFQVGGGPVLEQVKVQAFVAGLQSQLSQARLQVEASEDELRRLLALPVETPLDLEAVDTAGTSWEQATLGPASLPLRALDASLASSEAQLRLSSRKRLPSIDLGADYGYSGRTWEEQSLGWGVKAGLSLPLWDWGRLSAEKNQAAAQWALAKLHREANQREGEAELRRLKRQVAALQEEQKRLAALLPRLEAAATASARRYRLASLTLLDVTDIYNQWLQTLQAERAAHYGSLEALSRLAQVTGEPFGADHAP